MVVVVFYCFLSIECWKVTNLQQFLSDSFVTYKKLSIVFICMHLKLARAETFLLKFPLETFGLGF